MEVIFDDRNNYLWNDGNSPIKLKVPVNILKNWELTEIYDEKWQMDVKRTPSFPEKIESTGKTEFIELVP